MKVFRLAAIAVLVSTLSMLSGIKPVKAVEMSVKCSYAYDSNYSNNGITHHSIELQPTGTATTNPYLQNVTTRAVMYRGFYRVAFQASNAATVLQDGQNPIPTGANTYLVNNTLKVFRFKYIGSQYGYQWRQDTSITTDPNVFFANGITLGDIGRPSATGFDDTGLVIISFDSSYRVAVW